MGLIFEPEADAPLRQGDILEGVALYQTADDGEEAVPVDVDYVLVLSRHCNAVRKSAVIVAAITEVTPEDFAKLSELSLDETRRYLAAVRDGDGTPDRFYLGPLPGREPRRACARLDLVYSIQIPENDSARREWIASRRRGTLSNEHRRHLHTSLLLAFGREGFDDYAWWPDGDLKIMIAAGKRELIEAQRKQLDIVPNYQAAALAEKKVDEKIKGVGNQAVKATEGVNNAQDALDPCLAEWRRRHGDKDPME